MDSYLIRGGKRLYGTVTAQASKNATLPLLAASVLTEEPVGLRHVPDIADVRNMTRILQGLGCKVSWQGDTLTVDSACADTCRVPRELSKELRSSVFLLGSILSRFGCAKVSYPGGCDIGLRPIDLHIKGLKALGVIIREEGDALHCDGSNMHCGDVMLDFPSVGATENIMLAACKLRGETVVRNAAKEPEIVDLQNFINALGGRVSGAGTDTVRIEGVKHLHGISYSPLPDRIAVGTYLLACAVCGGKMCVEGCIPEHIYALLIKLRESACKIEWKNDKIYIEQNARPQSVHITETAPYPGFPTDLQSQFLTLASVSEGTGIIVENIFETRYKHVAELIKMGANIRIKDRIAIVRGVKELHGAMVEAHDLRGGAALVLAGLNARGVTALHGVRHIDRGYERLEEVFQSLGADISRKTVKE
ncbi:MAG: UDP-N-acetylglucosamine 1-carboxyvinyltransferase [Clostridia bacterium]|nr:UDP-N-acetylglucosamine 1-carboxyvinyltransferase [Clostridia bacterium]